MPTWLPPQAREARAQVFWAQIIAFVEVPVAILLSILMFYYYFHYSSRSFIATNPGARGLSIDFLAFGVYFLAIVFVSVLELVFTKVHISNTIDTGKYAIARERSMLWGVLSVLFGLIPGILLLAASSRLGELNRQIYQQTAVPAQESRPHTEHAQQPASQSQQIGTPQAAAPAAKQQVASQSSYVVPAAQKPHTDMVKCKKCGASYPAFMHACPNCNEPKG